MFRNPDVDRFQGGGRPPPSAGLDVLRLLIEVRRGARCSSEARATSARAHGAKPFEMTPEITVPGSPARSAANSRRASRRRVSWTGAGRLMAAMRSKCQSANRRFAPITSAACCGRSALKDAFGDFHSRQDRRTRRFATSRIAASARRSTMQEEVGLQSITDGEFRRGSWFLGFVEAVEGLTTQDALFDFHDAAGGHATFQTAYVEAKLRRRARGITTGEFAFVHGAHRAHTEGDDAGAEPGAFLPRRPDRRSRGLSRPRRVLGGSDRASTVRSCTRWPRSAAPTCSSTRCRCAMLCDPQVRERRDAAGARARRVGRHLYRAPSTRSRRRRPAGMGDRACICAAATTRATGWPKAATSRSRNGCSTRRGGCLLPRIRHARAGGFEPLRLVPNDKTVVLGLAQQQERRSSSRSTMLRRRIDAASRYVRARPARRSARNAALPAASAAIR